MSSDSPYLETLPSSPNLSHQRKRAKDLLKAFAADEADALRRVQALHPSPPERGAFALADAQLVIARGYGFPSWAKLKERIDSLAPPPVEQFVAAIYEGDIEAVEELLQNPDVRAKINAPLFHFGGRAAMQAKCNLPLLDLLLAHGADINLKSHWWAGPFGILDDATPEVAAPLIARGARVDVFAAARLGDFARLRELLDADPSLIHAKGGDGQRPLHYAQTIETARFLLDRGAEIDARCVDHESTAAQWMIADRLPIARFLVEQGAWFDIFLAVALGDEGLVEQAMADDPASSTYRIGTPPYKAIHAMHIATATDAQPQSRGDIYFWTLSGEKSALELAQERGLTAISDRLRAASAPRDRLFAAAAAADKEQVKAVVTQHPELVKSLSDSDLGRVANFARDLKLESVEALLDVGFPIDGRGQEGGTALHWACWRGQQKLVAMLIARGAPLEDRRNNHNGTPLGWAVHGAAHGWQPDRQNDYPGVVKMLLDAGAEARPSLVPCGHAGVDAVLRQHFSH